MQTKWAYNVTRESSAAEGSPVSNFPINAIALQWDIVHSLSKIEHYRIRCFGDLLSLSSCKNGERSLFIWTH